MDAITAGTKMLLAVTRAGDDFNDDFNEDF